MRQVTVNLYQFSELEERAKERARDWWRNASSGDNSWSEHTVEDFGDVLKACGYDYVNSAEYIDETIAANEYEFTADGERA